MAGALLVVSAASPAAAGSAPDGETWLREAQAILSRVDSYTAIFHKQERIDGTLLPEETIALKFKRPRMIQMRWIAKPFAGREVTYVEGRNGNRIHVREAGLLGLLPVDLDPTGSLAMKGNRHAVTEAGIESLVQRIADNLRRGRAAGEVETRDGGEETVYGRRTARLEGVFPVTARARYYCRRAVLSFDLETRVPIRVEIYDWDEALLELYGFEDLKLDAGLREADFGGKGR
jgi:hypothetical protein